MAKPITAASGAAPATLAATNLARTAAPAIPTPPPASEAPGAPNLTQSFNFSTVTVASGQSVLVTTPGSNFIPIASGYNLGGSAGAPSQGVLFSIQADDRAKVPVYTPGVPIKFERPFQTLRIFNDQAGYDLTINFYIGFAEIPLVALRTAFMSPVGVSPILGTPQSGTLTRPNNTTQYAIGDAVVDTGGAAMNINAVALMWGTSLVGSQYARIVSARLEKDGSTVTNAAFRLFLYSASVTPPADNAPYPYPYNSNVSAIVDFPAMSAEGGTGGAYCEVQSAYIPVRGATSGGALKGILVAEAAYTPAANENFRVTLLCEYY